MNYYNAKIDYNKLYFEAQILKARLLMLPHSDRRSHLCQKAERRIWRRWDLLQAARYFSSSTYSALTYRG
jgi:hypothetical protein